jgi:molybdate transport system substrate-binding protein
MKKVSILLIASMLLCLVLGACGSSTTETATESEAAVEETTEAVETTETTEEATEEETEEPAEEEEAAPAEEEATPAEEETVEEEPVELIVFAAASMTETLTEIAEMYKDVAPNVTLTFNFDSSGTLKTQIEEGADCDVFISAAQKQMNQLDISKDEEKNPDRLDFVLSDTRVNLLENKVALVVPADNAAGIESYEDLTTDKLTLLCLGNDDVPVGQYSLEILEYLGVDVTELESAGKVTYGSNVKEVTTQVSEGTVDCGIIYATDAFSAGLDIVDLATADMCSQVIYPAAVLNISQNQDAAQAFLDYLQTDEAMAVFESVGFSAVE